MTSSTGWQRSISGAHDDAVGRGGDAIDPESGNQLDAALIEQVAHARAELAAFLELVRSCAAEQLADGPAADRPDDLRVRFLVGERREIEQGIQRRVPAADDQHPPARVRVRAAPRTSGMP